MFNKYITKKIQQLVKVIKEIIRTDVLPDKTAQKDLIKTISLNNNLVSGKVSVCETPMLAYNYVYIFQINGQTFRHSVLLDQRLNDEDLCVELVSQISDYLTREILRLTMPDVFKITSRTIKL